MITRPFDISILYEQLKANDVVFGTPDKGSLGNQQYITKVVTL